MLARQLLCSNFETQNERAVEMFISSSVLTVSLSENTPSHPRSTQCSCEEVKVHIKEQITFLNQSNDFIHTGHVCYGVSHQSPALKRTQTLTMKNTFLKGNSGFLFFSFLIVFPRTVQPPLLATHCHLQDSQQLAGNNLFPSHD